MSEVLQTIHARRSTRAFTDRQVSREDLEAILEAGAWAPSGMGKYLWHFSAIRNADKVLELAHAVAAADNRGPEYNFYGAPCHIIISNQRDEKHAFLDGSAALENMLLAAQSLGLSTCWINPIRATCDDPGVRALLTAWGIPEDHVVIGSIALGYGAKETPAKPRREGVITIVE